jgi:hypothetical protein
LGREGKGVGMGGFCEVVGKVWGDWWVWVCRGRILFLRRADLRHKADLRDVALQRAGL